MLHCLTCVVFVVVAVVVVVNYDIVLLINANITNRSMKTESQKQK